MRTIAVLMTCHNRRPMTIGCLERLFAQRALEQPTLRMDVYLVDDGSTDGTADEIERRFARVRIIRGDGNLFWNGGMRVALRHARAAEYDFFVWLNDDTMLMPEALGLLIGTYDELVAAGARTPIVVGSNRDAVTGEPTYGGLVHGSALNRFSYRMVVSSEVPRPVDTMNGNFVLVPREAVDVLGEMNPAFRHSMGDLDYGLSARKAGFEVYVAPGYVGTCSGNPRVGTWKDTALPRRERWRKSQQPKGLLVEEWKALTHAHGGPLWFLYWFMPYRRFWLQALMDRLRGSHAD